MDNLTKAVQRARHVASIRALPVYSRLLLIRGDDENIKWFKDHGILLGKPQTGVTKVRNGRSRCLITILKSDRQPFQCWVPYRYLEIIPEPLPGKAQRTNNK